VTRRFAKRRRYTCQRHTECTQRSTFNDYRDGLRTRKYEDCGSRNGGFSTSRHTSRGTRGLGDEYLTERGLARGAEARCRVRGRAGRGARSMEERGETRQSGLGREEAKKGKGGRPTTRDQYTKIRRQAAHTRTHIRVRARARARALVFAYILYELCQYIYLHVCKL